MNKLCIVWRRQKRIQEIGGKTDFISDTKTVSSPYSYRGGIASLSESDSRHIFNNADDTLCEAARSCHVIDRAGVGEGRHITVDVEGNDGTHSILKINFNRPKAGALLKYDDVCDMLQVSKSFVAKLVRTRAVKSYKMGRLRWFAVEEILHYLTRNERETSF